jgi:uncharacterized membrane protein YccC
LLSFALCLAYLLVLPFHPVGLAVLVGLGTLILTIVGRHEDVVTAGISTAVVMVVAALAPANAWEEPILRLLDTAVGIAVGLAAARLTCKVTARVHALAGARTYNRRNGTAQAGASAGRREVARP